MRDFLAGVALALAEPLASESSPPLGRRFFLDDEGERLALLPTLDAEDERRRDDRELREERLDREPAASQHPRIVNKIHPSSSRCFESSNRLLD